MTCGDCNICCKVFPIEELDSPKGEYCKNCTNEGCSIHPTRPQICRDFKCAYLENNWREELRPDNCGVMIYRNKKGQLKALRCDNEVNPLIMNQIKFIETNYNEKILGVDAR